MSFVKTLGFSGTDEPSDAGARIEAEVAGGVVVVVLLVEIELDELVVVAVAKVGAVVEDEAGAADSAGDALASLVDAFSLTGVD